MAASKKYIGASVLPKFDFFENPILKNAVFVFLSLVSDVSTSRSMIVKRAMKKHARGLIFRFFGWLGGPSSPKQHYKSSSDIISTLNPS